VPFFAAPVFFIDILLLPERTRLVIELTKYVIPPEDRQFFRAAWYTTGIYLATTLIPSYN